MFETSKPASLPWYVMLSPTMPADVTPDQVRKCVASYPGVQAIELSAAFLGRRPGSDVSEWRRLDQELEGAGINVYFVPGGCATWEVHFCAGPPGTVSGGEDPGPSRTADNGIEDEIAAVTSPSPEIDKGEVVLQPKQTPTDALQGVPLKDRMRRLAAEGHSTRMIADILSAEGHRVSHMTVARAVRRPKESSQPRLL